MRQSMRPNHYNIDSWKKEYPACAGGENTRKYNIAKGTDNFNFKLPMPF